MASLTLRYSELADVAQDLDIVIQSTTEDEWEWRADAGERERWHAFVTSTGRDVTESELHGLSGRATISPQVSLVFILSSCTAPIEATAEISAPAMPLAYVKELREALIKRSTEWDEQGVTSLFFFELFTAAQTFIADHSRIASQEELSESIDDAAKQHGERQPTEIQMSRAIFWSHHLKAPSKLKDFNNWCPELDLWGLLLVGWPGYLCFEGPKESIDEMIRRVKRLQWHAIQLRLQEDWTYAVESKAQRESAQLDAMSQALLSCSIAKGHSSNTATQESDFTLQKTRTGCEVLHDLSDMVDRLRRCGLEEDMVTQVLGLRISSK